MAGVLKTACKFPIMLYYLQILDSVFLSTCFFQLAQVLYFFLELIYSSSLNWA